MLAVPVAPHHMMAALRAAAADVVGGLPVDTLWAVGAFDDDFVAVDDAVVVALLQWARARHGAPGGAPGLPPVPPMAP